MLSEEEKSPKILDPIEVKWLITSFLMHPDRLESGATQEEIIKVIEWAQETKLSIMVNLGILYSIYDEQIVINYRDGEVFLSYNPKPPTEVRNPEQFLNVESLIQ